MFWALMKRREDIEKEYQRGYQKAYQEAYQEGLKEGLEEGLRESREKRRKATASVAAATATGGTRSRPAYGSAGLSTITAAAVPEQTEAGEKLTVTEEGVFSASTGKRIAYFLRDSHGNIKSIMLGSDDSDEFTD